VSSVIAQTLGMMGHRAIRRGGTHLKHAGDCYVKG